ncbi:hypothetical protein [Paenibacillus lemnae]|uniref:Amidase n=1 Tax=Paenibacillus lemnae TaxID=1330551 RepID=A0A848MA93_PAELE|nr:hypothetical protein [Paenibacillus lemnae]NMO96833.1 hypothetical protein [Paenibacillus lemnae]
MKKQRCRRLTCTLLAAVLLLACVQLPAYAQSAEGKATWVWQTELIRDGGERLLSFAEQEGINLIYLQIDREIPAGIYNDFIQEAHRNEIHIHALGGDPRWALTKYQGDMIGLAEWVTSYNEGASPEGSFDGIHLDIEPYVLPQWETAQGEVIASWRENLQAFLDRASGTGVELGIDIPFWLDEFTLPDGGNLNAWLMSSFDHVTVMAYRNQAETEHGILYLTKQELELGDRLGTKVRIAVNTKEMPGEEHTTFYSLGRQQMNQTLENLSGTLRAHSSFAGLAVHDFRYWENMSQTGTEGPAEGLPDPDVQPAPDPGTDPAPDPVPDPDPVPGERVPDADPVTRSESIRGTYIWRAEEVIHNSREILDFAKEKNLNFLYVRLDLQQPFSAYRSFMKEASSAGIEVHALGGHPIWALQENRDRMLKLVNYVKDYNRVVEGDERFHGIHLDIEPYVLPEWSADSQNVITQWTSNIDAFVRELKADSSLKASMDMAVWLDKHPVPGEGISVSEWMIDRMDHVSLMAFRDRAEGSNGILSVTREELAIAERLGKPMLISVEIKESHEGGHITFYEEGAAFMEQELATVQKHLQQSSSFRGNLVHAYEYWRDARP